MSKVRFLEIRVIREEAISPDTIWNGRTTLFKMGDIFTSEPGNLRLYPSSSDEMKMKIETVHYQILKLQDPNKGQFQYAVNFEEFDHAIPIIEGIIGKQTEKFNLKINVLEKDVNLKDERLMNVYQELDVMRKHIIDNLAELNEARQKLREETRKRLLAKLSQALLDELRQEMTETKATLAMVPKWELRVRKTWLDMTIKFKKLFLKYTDKL